MSLHASSLKSPTALAKLSPARDGFLQRQCACGNHTIAGGTCTECAKRTSGLQRKLTIGASGDPLEQEADRVANQVLAAPSNSTIGIARPRIQRFTNTPGEGTDSAPASVDRVLAGSGTPLGPPLRQDMERRFGYDFSGVRLHSGMAADESARDVGAQAYTVGQNVVFGAGRFSPGTDSGRRLLAHELTHVVQQNGGPYLRHDSDRAFLQRAPDPAQRTFSPTRFSDPSLLLKAVLKDNPKEEDLAGACRFLSALPMASIIGLASQVAARKPAVVGMLREKALQGWAGSHVRVALAAVMIKGQISRVGFAIEHASKDLPALPARDAALVLDVLGPAIPELAAMQKSKGFQALRPDEQLRLSFLIGGSTSLSMSAIAAMRTLLADRRASKDDPATFRRFITDEKYLKFHPTLPLGVALPRSPVTVGAAVDVPNYAFGDEGPLAAAAIRRDVTVDAKDSAGKPVKQTIPVFMPKSAGIKDKSYGTPTIKEIADILAVTPDVSRSKIVRIDVHWMKGSETGRPRDNVEVHMAAGEDGVVNVYPIKTRPHDHAENTMSLMHETGHTASLAAWGDSATDKRWDPWRAAMKSDGMGVSKYGKESVDEDFAESWALYAPLVGTRREDEIRALIPARCRLMDSLLWQQPKRPKAKP